jgi:hypothetical protein
MGESVDHVVGILRACAVAPVRRRSSQQLPQPQFPKREQLGFQERKPPQSHPRTFVPSDVQDWYGLFGGCSAALECSKAFPTKPVFENHFNHFAERNTAHARKEGQAVASVRPEAHRERGRFGASWANWTCHVDGAECA